MAEPRRSTANDASGRAASDLKGARILIVEARFYEDIADALLPVQRARWKRSA